MWLCLLCECHGLSSISQGLQHFRCPPELVLRPPHSHSSHNPPILMLRKRYGDIISAISFIFMGYHLIAFPNKDIPCLEIFVQQSTCMQFLHPSCNRQQNVQFLIHHTRGTSFNIVKSMKFLTSPLSCALELLTLWHLESRHPTLWRYILLLDQQTNPLPLLLSVVGSATAKTSSTRPSLNLFTTTGLE